MAVPTISRTPWYAGLVDDDGSGLVGTIWNKAAVNTLLNLIDALIAVINPGGAWIAVAYNAANFITGGAGSWTVTSGNQAIYRYVVNGKTMTLAFVINGTNVTAAVNLRIAIPGGYLPAVQMHSQFRALNAGVGSVGLAIVNTGVPWVDLYKDQDANNFSITAANNTYATGTITFEVQ